MHKVATSGHRQQLTVLVHDPVVRSSIPKSSRIQVLKSPPPGNTGATRNVFVFTAATQLKDVATFVSMANSRRQLRALFVRDDLDPYWLPALFERAGMRTLRNTVPYSEITIPLRILRAWMHGAQEHLIADAKVSSGRLFVTSCDLHMCEVPVPKIPALKNLREADLADFRIDEDGSFLLWPKADFHLDLDAVRAAIDPAWRARVRRVRAIHDTRYGAAILQIRREKGLKQSEIHGLSERQVRRIEQGASATAKALLNLAESHGMSLKNYLDTLAETMKKQSEEGSPATESRRRQRTHIAQSASAE